MKPALLPALAGVLVLLAACGDAKEVPVKVTDVDHAGMDHSGHAMPGAASPAGLTEAHHRAPSIFGMDSPWQRFIGCEHAKVLGLGISMGPVTFYHALEDAMGDAFPVPVWENDTKLLACLDHAGRRWEVPVRPFDPAVAQRRIDHPGRGDLRDYFHREFDAAGLRVNGQVGDAASWAIPAQAFFGHLRQLASEHVTIYASAAQLAARPIGRA